MTSEVLREVKLNYAFFCSIKFSFLLNKYKSFEAYINDNSLNRIIFVKN